MKLPRKISLIASGSAMLFALPACAQTQSLPAPVESVNVPAAEMELGNATSAGPALWKVADEDTTIYLFGTVHALPDDIDWYSGEVKTAIEASDTLVTEIDLTPEALAAMPAVVTGMAVYTDGTTLRGVMDDDQRAVFETSMTKLGLPVGALDQYEPWFAAFNLVQVALANAGISPAAGTEFVLEAKVGPDVERAALETIEYQFGIFDSLPLEAQLEFLLEGAAEVDSLAPILQEIIDLWAVGNIDAVADLMNRAFEEEPDLAKALLFDRNMDWAEWIDTRLDTPGTVFMAVGAGHLAGDKSVQEFLAGKGIQSSRVQ
ncbi:MAG: TraB/GumN family protein [Pseudomonadota bacterium]